MKEGHIALYKFSKLYLFFVLWRITFLSVQWMQIASFFMLYIMWHSSQAGIDRKTFYAEKNAEMVQLEGKTVNISAIIWSYVFSCYLWWIYQNIVYELAQYHTEHLNKSQYHFREILLHLYPLNILNIMTL